MKDFQQIKHQAKTLLDSGNFVQAKEKFQQAYELNQDDIDVLTGLGILYIKLQDAENAKLWLERSEKKSDEQKRGFPAICYFYLGSIYRQLQQSNRAIEYFQSAIATYHDFPMAHAMLAGLFMARKDLEEAEYHYQYAIKLQPGNADAIANLAQVYELLNKTDEARQAVSKAFEIQKDHIGAMMALAKVEKREKNYVKAENIFRDIIDIANDDTVKAMAFIELAHTLDKQKKFDKAFSTITRGKLLWQEMIKSIPFDKKAYQTKISSNKSYLLGNTFKVIDKNTAVRSPIFFVGFPRSGTTLLEQILNQHSLISTSDEKLFLDTVIAKIQTLTNSTLPYPECLNELNNNDIDQLRKIYWDEVNKEIDEFNDDSVLVDKLPLNIIELGLINKLFPDAHILVALRDPRDVCLSAFMQAFTPNPAMINFLNMDTTVAFYTQVMALWINYRDRLPLNWHQYRYEDLVSDFDTTTRKIFAFLDLEYPENALDFHIAAANRSINTPSYQDVATPIYQRSAARWRNYEKHFQPYHQQLLPFINEFDYA